MSLKLISKFVLLTAIVAAVAHLAATTNARAGILGTRCLDQTGCCLRCPACDHVCKLDAEKVDEEIDCFDVETKVICIPRVVFPWQKKKCRSCSSCDGNGCSNCVNNGARTRRICVLKPSSYECPKCKYTWSVEKRGGCSGGCAAGQCCCDASACDAPVCDAVAPTYSTHDEVMPPADDEVLTPTDPVLTLPTAYGNPLPFSPVVQSLRKLGK